MIGDSTIDVRSAHRTLLEDPVLGPVVEGNGVVRLEPAEDFFERLCLSVVRQQISMTAADAIFDRLESSVTLTPEELAVAEADALRELGLSASKARTLRALAGRWQDEGWDRAFFATRDDDAVMEALTSVRGIGPWTAKMALLFGLGRPDVWPVEDLGIRRGMNRLHDEELDREAMTRRAEDWRPYRSVAAIHVWRMED